MSEQYFNLEAEQATLGAFFLDADLIKETKLTTDSFYQGYMNGKHRKLFATMKDLAEKGMPIDVVTLSERLKNKAENLDKVGGISYMAELSSMVPNTRNFRHYENIVLDLYRKRQIMLLGTEMATGQLLESRAEDRLKEIMRIGFREQRISAKEDLIGLYDEIEEGQNDKNVTKTRYRDLDNLISGFERQTLYIVAARPSVGKTAFAVNMLVNSSESNENRSGGKGVFFSGEQPKRQINRRAIGATGSIPLTALKIGKDAMSDHWLKLTHSLAIMGSMDYEVYDQPAMDMAYIWMNARQERKENPDTHLIIYVDYLQLIVGKPNYRGSKSEEVGEMAKEFKLMARELDCSVVLLSQLNRGVEQRQDKRPMLSDLRDSGEIEQAADTVMFLYREDYYDKETEDQNMIEIIVAKQREGATGTAKLANLREYGKFLTIDWSARNG